MSAAPIYVVVSPHGGAGYSSGHHGEPKNPGGPIVHETDIGEPSTLEKAQHRAACLERRFGPCRVARLVFEDHPAFYERRDICTEGDCAYNGQKRPSTCACSKGGA